MWFKVDDAFWRHRKQRKLRKDRVGAMARTAAAGLWVLAGSYCGDNLTDGFISAEQVREWDPQEDLAQRLVAAEYWVKAEQDGESGYQFVDWDQWQPVRADVMADRDAARERMKRLRAGRAGTRSPERAPNVRGTFATGAAEAPSEPSRAGTRSPERAPNVRGTFATDAVAEHSETAAHSDPFARTHSERSPHVRGTFVTPTRPDPTSSSSRSAALDLVATTLGLNPKDEDDDELSRKVYDLILTEHNPDAPSRYIQTLANNGDLHAIRDRILRTQRPPTPTYTGPTHTFEQSAMALDTACARTGCGLPAHHIRHRTPTSDATAA